MKISWAPIFGSISDERKILHYIPESDRAAPASQDKSFALIRSNQYFESGRVSFLVRFEDKDSSVQLVLNSTLQREVFVGLKVGYYYGGIAAFANGKWENIDGSGADTYPPVNEWIKVEVSVMGSYIELFINGVLVSKSSKENIFRSQLGLFFKGKGSIFVKDFLIRQQKPKAFVVMQFTPEFDALYSQVICPTCESYGFECVRADDIYNNGLIISDIVKSIQEAAVIIADITPDNLNVYYEVGYAHGLSKPTIST